MLERQVDAAQNTTLSKAIFPPILRKHGAGHGHTNPAQPPCAGGPEKGFRAKPKHSLEQHRHCGSDACAVSFVTAVSRQEQRRRHPWQVCPAVGTLELYVGSSQQRRFLLLLHSCHWSKLNAFHSR